MRLNFPVQKLIGSLFSEFFLFSSAHKWSFFESAMWFSFWLNSTYFVIFSPWMDLVFSRLTSSVFFFSLFIWSIYLASKLYMLCGLWDIEYYFLDVIWTGTRNLLTSLRLCWYGVYYILHFPSMNGWKFLVTWKRKSLGWWYSPEYFYMLPWFYMLAQMTDLCSAKCQHGDITEIHHLWMIFWTGEWAHIICAHFR